MTPTGRAVTLGVATLVAAAALTVAPATWARDTGAQAEDAVPAGPEKPHYTNRFRIPFRGDDLGYSRSVAVDLQADEIFVADWRKNRIVIFDARNIFRYQIAGGRMFSSPADIAIDPEGYLFVLPAVGTHLLLLDFDGLFLERLDFQGLGDLPLPRVVSLAIAPAGDRLYVLDETNFRLWILDRNARVLGQFDFGEGRNEQELRDLFFGHVDVYADTVLVSVPTDGNIYLFDLDGTHTGLVGRKGSAPCHTMLPVAAALDADGRVIILDSQRALGSVWEVPTNRCIAEFAGFGNLPGGLYRPLDLALDAYGRIYISQGFEGRVQVYEHSAPAAGASARPPLRISPALREAVSQSP